MGEMMKIKICVTKDDIKRGIPCLNCRCPVALAAKRALRGKGLRLKAVHSVKINLTKNGSYAAITLPSSAQDFIEAFDAFDSNVFEKKKPALEVEVAHQGEWKRKIKPFSFVLKVPLRFRHSDEAKGKK